MIGLQKRILGTVALHHACNDASVVVLPAIFPVLYTEGILIKRYSDIGTITLISLFVAITTQILIGHNVKTHHYRRFLGLDALIVGIFLLLMTLSRNYLMLVACFIGVRIGTSIYHPVGISWISHAFEGTTLDRSMGFQSAFGDIGVLTAFISTGLLTDYFGWRVPLILWGAINLIALVAGQIISRGTTDRTAIDAKQEAVSWRETVAALRIFIFPILLGGLAWGISLNYAPSLLNHKLGISMSKTGLILSCWMAAGATVTIFYGRISERIGRPATILAAYSAIILTSFTLGSTDNIGLTVAAFIIYGVSLFITFPAILSFVGSTMAAKNRTAGFSLVSNIQIVGNSIFAFISGFISDAYGIHSPFLLLGGITVLVVVYLIVIINKGLVHPGPVPAAGRPKDIVPG
jgi:MFS family permease